MNSSTSLNSKTASNNKRKITLEPRRILRFVALIGFVGLLVTLAFLLIAPYVNSFANPPKQVRVTNITSRSATISWYTKTKDSGFVVFGEDQSFGVWPFVEAGKKKAFDDRDYARAEAKAVESMTNSASTKVSADLTVDLNQDIVKESDITVSQIGLYYVHHVTLKNLNPETDYYFKVGNGSKYWTIDEIKNEAKGYDVPVASAFNFKTFVESTNSTDLLAPNSAYGRVLLEKSDGTKVASEDGIVFAAGYKVGSNGIPVGQTASLYISAVPNTEGGWSLDKSNLKTSTGTPALNYVNGTDSLFIAYQLGNNTLYPGQFLKWGIEDAPAADVTFTEYQLRENESVAQASSSIVTPVLAAATSDPLCCAIRLDRNGPVDDFYSGDFEDSISAYANQLGGATDPTVVCPKLFGPLANDYNGMKIAGYSSTPDIKSLQPSMIASTGVDTNTREGCERRWYPDGNGKFVDENSSTNPGGTNPGNGGTNPGVTTPGGTGFDYDSVATIISKSDWDCAKSKAGQNQVWTCLSGTSRMYKCNTNGIPLEIKCSESCVSAGVGNNDYCKNDKYLTDAGVVVTPVKTPVCCITNQASPSTGDCTNSVCQWNTTGTCPTGFTKKSGVLQNRCTTTAQCCVENGKVNCSNDGDCQWESKGCAGAFLSPGYFQPSTTFFTQAACETGVTNPQTTGICCKPSLFSSCPSASCEWKPTATSCSAGFTLVSGINTELACKGSVQQQAGVCCKPNWLSSSCPNSQCKWDAAATSCATGSSLVSGKNSKASCEGDVTPTQTINRCCYTASNKFEWTKMDADATCHNFKLTQTTSTGYEYNSRNVDSRDIYNGGGTTITQNSCTNTANNRKVVIDFALLKNGNTSAIKALLPSCTNYQCGMFNIDLEIKNVERPDFYDDFESTIIERDNKVYGVIDYINKYVFNKTTCTENTPSCLMKRKTDSGGGDYVAWIKMYCSHNSYVSDPGSGNSENSCPSKFSCKSAADGMAGLCVSDEFIDIPARLATGIKMNGSLSFKTSAASNLISTDSTNSTVAYFAEDGLFTVDLGAQYSIPNTVLADKDSKYRFYVERNGTKGYQVPADLKNIKSNEDYLIDLKGIEISVDKVAKNFKMELSEGMNLVSFPFLASKNGSSSYKASDLFYGQDGKLIYGIKGIASFDNGRWGNMFMIDSAGNKRGVDFPIVFGKGYVIIATRDLKGTDSLMIPGYDVREPIPVAFKAGWNLVGIHGYTQSFTGATLIDSISGTAGLTADNVTKWSTDKAKYEGVQKSGNAVYGFDFPIYKSAGYFVRISSFSPTDTKAKSILWNPGGDSNGITGTN